MTPATVTRYAVMCRDLFAPNLDRDGVVDVILAADVDALLAEKQAQLDDAKSQVDNLMSGLVAIQRETINAWMESARNAEAQVADLTRQRAAQPAAETPIGKNYTADVAYDFVRYYVAGTTGCRNCGGLPHSAECFVGKFVVALALDSLAPAAETWQPIASAPKDRKLMFWDGFDVVTGQWIELGDGFGEWNIRELCAEDPTHWADLPSPPRPEPREPKSS